MKSIVFVVLSLMVMILVSGCTSQEQSPVDVVVKHLEARAAGDADALRGLTCAAREGEVDRMARSLEGLDAKLNDVSCSFDDAATVNCTGSIQLNYQGELRSNPVKNYSVIQEDGQWKWCGEAE